MSESIHVAGMVGSLREESYTREAMRIALAGARDAGGETTLVDLREYAIPMFNQDVEPTEDVDRMAATIGSADAILLGTPMYHGSYSGVLKNAIDHCGFDEFEDKTVGLLTVSGGGFPIPAMEHLRAVCRSLNAWVLPWEAAVPRGREVIADGRVVDESLDTRVRTLGRRAVEYARIEPHQSSLEGDQNVGATER